MVTQRTATVTGVSTVDSDMSVSLGPQLQVVENVLIIGDGITSNAFDAGAQEAVATWFVDAGYTVTRRDQSVDATQVTNSEGFDLAVGVTSVGAVYTAQDLTDSTQTPWMSTQITGNMNNIGFADSGTFTTYAGTDCQYVTDSAFAWTGETTATNVIFTTATGNAMDASTSTLGGGATVVLRDDSDTDVVCVVYDNGDALANAKGTAVVRGGFLGWWQNRYDELDAGGKGDQFLNDFISWLGN